MSERTSSLLPPDPETEWEVIVALRDPGKQRAALERLLGRYERVVRMRMAAAGEREPEDAFQDFAAWVVAGNRFATADQERGQFRCFLATMITRWLSNRRREAMAQKRGGGAEHVTMQEATASVEGAAEGRFDREWAQEVLRHATEGMVPDVRRQL